MEHLSQNEILRSSSRTNIQRTLSHPRRRRVQIWPLICCICTFLIPNCILRLFRIRTKTEQQAWREKYTLCVLISLLCGFLAFITYGINVFICRSSEDFVYSNLGKSKLKSNYILADGMIKYIDKSYDIGGCKTIRNNCFNNEIDSCVDRFNRKNLYGKGPLNISYKDVEDVAPIHFTWKDIRNNNFLVIDNKVYDPTSNRENFFNNFIDEMKGCDATAASSKFTKAEMSCFKESFFAGSVSRKSIGCVVADFILYLSTVAIFSLILTRFFLATFYSWYIRHKMSRITSLLTTHSICLVTCYSEDREGLKSTLDSLSEQNYQNKLIVVIADGIIKGSGCDKTTPEILLELMEVDNTLPILPLDYLSLAKGRKGHNRAMVYPGYYLTATSKSSMILIVKCGNDSETVKPGNRGKRDSQVILMSFFSKLIYDDRFSELDYDIYKKIRYITNTDPKDFELVLMVDADTIVYPDALTNFVSVFETDQKVMGMCGETKILNKAESWVTMIQVFEYYISHHLTKSFESVFGGVTCLPGCFCIYRIYSNHTINGQKALTPILANAFILNEYSVCETDTLHKKNLLLLGEDRYLTTILLKNFYKRKLVFLPKAKCKTFVPSSFGVLLSQRRRWINSTIHNLFELVKVNKLCGTCCCSMRFVIIMELFGTLVLPAAIIFTGVLLVSSILGEPSWIPLIMLVGILGLPAVLILLTNMEISQIFWLLIYIVSLPIWNFVLPVYSFWHFDDFTWGETRKIDGEGDKVSEQDEGEVDMTMIKLKHLNKLENM